MEWAKRPRTYILSTKDVKAVALASNAPLSKNNLTICSERKNRKIVDGMVR